MPVSPTYPGVYVEEVPSGVRTISGVSTSIAAFVGYFRRGPMDEAVRLFSQGDFEREFGGLDRRSEASYAIQQFFLNGGTEAWVVRTASGTVEEADVVLADEGGAPAVTVTAIHPGAWGTGLRLIVDYPEPDSDDRFNLTVALVEERGGTELATAAESFTGLTVATAETVVNDEFAGSKLIRLGAVAARPAATGTLSAVLVDPEVEPSPPFPDVTAARPQIEVSIGPAGDEETGRAVLAGAPASLAEARTMLESAIRAARPAVAAFAQARVSVVDGRLRVVAGGTEPGGDTDADAVVRFAAATDPSAGELGLDPGETLEGRLSADLSAVVFPAGPGSVDVTIDGDGPHTLELDEEMADVQELRALLETRIHQASPAPGDARFEQARVVVRTVGADERLIVLAGTPGAAVDFGPGGDLLVTELNDQAVTLTVSEVLDPVPVLRAGAAVEIDIGGDARPVLAAHRASNLAAIAAELEAGIHAVADGDATFADARVIASEAGGEARLVVVPGTIGDAVGFADHQDATSIDELGLAAADAFHNVQAYRLGQGAAIAGTAQGAGTAGDDGDPPDAEALIGDEVARTGFHALDAVDLFNLLAIPRTARVTGADALDPNPETARNAALAVIQAATAYCLRRRAFFLVDPPNDVDDVQEVKDWLAAAGIRHRNAALYFPRVEISDPLDDFRLRAVGPSGTMAGLYARTDATRGVWKAPAGTEATLVGAQRLQVRLNDPQNGTLNPLAINALREFPVYGRVAWGARTLVGANDLASEWQYVPVRRLALFLEESLYRGTQWVVFEPNDEPLWAQIRLNVGAFMQSLFLQGAFQGTTPRDAYLVKCDGETTTQDDVNRGIVNVVVGFAPLRPAEFVILKIQQLAGRLAAA